VFAAAAAVSVRVTPTKLRAAAIEAGKRGMAAVDSGVEHRDPDPRQRRRQLALHRGCVTGNGIGRRGRARQGNDSEERREKGTHKRFSCRRCCDDEPILQAAV
jgi:hypothetical protein